jgi:probable O-glycosylation ligase (exosortase A-associated)
MLHTTFVLALIITGTYYALQGPFYALLFYLWNAYFRPEDKIWQDFLLTGNLSFIIGAYLVLVTLLSGRKLILNGRVILIALFLAETFLSTLLSPHYEYSWPYWKEFLKQTVIGYVMLILIDDFSKFRMVLLVIALSLGVSEAKQGWFYLFTSPGGPNTNPLWFLGDNNGVALGMLMLVPIFVLLAQTTPRKWARSFYWFLVIGVFYRALSTYSRGGFLASCFLGSIYWLQSRQKVRSLLVLLAVLIVIVPNLPDSFWTRMHTIATYQEVQDESALGRLHFWRVALLMARDHPFLGVGFNAYNRAYDQYDFSQGRYGHMRSVHSSFFGVIAELGYIGIALFATILFSAFHSCHRVSKIAVSDPELPHLRLAANSLRLSLLVFLIGGSFLPSQYQEMLWHCIFLSFPLDAIAMRAALKPHKVSFHPVEPNFSNTYGMS